MTMITVYQPSRSGGEESEKEAKKVVPAGMTYFTKVNGKLVMARSKKDTPADNAISILGGSFGTKPARKKSKSPVRKRSKSIGAAPTPLLIGGIPYLPQPGAQIPQLAYYPNNQMGMPPNSQPGPTVSGPPYMPNPTPADFDKLRGFDAHYTKYVVSDQKKSKDTKKHKTTTTTTSNLARHICGHCGGLRSKRYHLQHPIVPGETPIPGFCRRCQRDASSTSSASSTEEPRRRKKSNDRYKGKNGKKKKSVRVVDLDRGGSLVGDAQRFESSGGEMESYVRRRKPDHKREHARYVPAKGIITVQEEAADQEVGRGRKGRRLHKTREISLSRVRYPEQDRSQVPRLTAPRSPSPLFRHVDAHRRKERRGRSLSPFYRHVKAPRDHKRKERDKVSIKFFEKGAEGNGKERRLFEEELRESNRGRKISIDVLEEGEELVITPPKRKTIPVYFSDDNDEPLTPENPPPRRRTSRRDFQPPAMPSRDSSFGSLDTSSSSRSRVASERRRRERNSPVFPQAPWGPVHESPTRTCESYPVHPKRSQSHLQVYRPKRELEEERRREGELEEERRRQEYIDRVTLERRDQDMQAKRFSMMDEAARYYQDDWRNEEYSDVEPEPAIRRRVSRKSYRTDRDGYREEASIEAELSYRTEPYDLPQAPSPPSPTRRGPKGQDGPLPKGRTDEEIWQNIVNAPPYPITPEHQASIRYDYPSERETRAEIRRPSPVVSEDERFDCEARRRPSPLASEEEYYEQQPTRSQSTSVRIVEPPEEFQQFPIRSRSISRARIVTPPEDFEPQVNRSRSTSRVPSQPRESLESPRSFGQGFAHVRPEEISERRENRSRSTSRIPASRESSRPPTHTRERAHFSDESPEFRTTYRERSRSAGPANEDPRRYYGETSEAPTRMRSASDLKRVHFLPDPEHRERTVSARASEISALSDYEGGNEWEELSHVDAGGEWETPGFGPTPGWS